MQILESAKTKLGNKIEIIGNSGENQVLIIGVVHGDEPQGKYLIESYLKEHSAKSLFIPCLNHDGLQLNNR